MFSFNDTNNEQYWRLSTITNTYRWRFFLERMTVSELQLH